MAQNDSIKLAQQIAVWLAGFVVTRQAVGQRDQSDLRHRQHRDF